MANTYWTSGDSDGDLTNNANWSGNAPGNGDNAFFPASANGLTPPTVNPDGLVDTIALIQIGEGVTYNVGASGDPLKVMATTVEHLGRGILYYDTDANAASQNLVMRCGPGGAADLTGTATGPRTDFRLLAGAITMASGLTITNYEVSVGSDAAVTFSTGGSVIATLHQMGGDVTAGPSITLAHVTGGTLRLDNVGITGALHLKNGHVFWNSASTIAKAELWDGAILESKAGAAQTLSESWRYDRSLLKTHTALVLTDDHIHGGNTE
jgi:hypothetical protein